MEVAAAEKGFNDAEDFAFHLARRTFLTFWSYLNPVRPDNKKEFCDVLVIHGDDVILFSVKEVKLAENKPADVAADRWLRKAIEDSIGQLDGAHRVLPKITHVIAKDQDESLHFPKKPTVHRVAIAFGSKGQVDIPLFVEDDQGVVTHVFREEALISVMSEVDTVTDFLQYLRAREGFLAWGPEVILEGNESDLLAFYLMSERKFPTKKDGDFYAITAGFWDAYHGKPEVKAKHEANKVSYAWDDFIDFVAKPHLDKHPEVVGLLSDAERVLRAMASENRFYRRVLGKSLIGFVEKTKANQDMHHRRRVETAEILYVFQGVPATWSRQKAQDILRWTCHVARGQSSRTKVIGISIINLGSGEHREDLLYWEKEDWTSKDQEEMQDIQKATGIFTNPVKTGSHEQEYPES